MTLDNFQHAMTYCDNNTTTMHVEEVVAMKLAVSGEIIDVVFDNPMSTGKQVIETLHKYGYCYQIYLDKFGNMSTQVIL